MKTIFTSMLIFIGILFIGMYFFVGELSDSLQPTYRLIELRHNKNILYINSKNWGVTGDSQLTYIASVTNDEFKIDSSKQIVFSGLQPFLYEQIQDTLFLYLRKKVVVSKAFNLNWKIIQVEVDNPTMMKLYSDKKYKKI